jgi:hypothetical protein
MRKFTSGGGFLPPRLDPALAPNSHLGPREQPRCIRNFLRAGMSLLPDRACSLPHPLEPLGRIRPRPRHCRRRFASVLSLRSLTRTRSPNLFARYLLARHFHLRVHRFFFS